MSESDDSQSNYENKNTFRQKIKKDPMVPIGLAGLTGIVIYGIYNFRNKRNMPNSIYLIHLRLMAQGTLMTCLTAGIAYTLFRDHISKLFNKDTKQQ